MTQPAIKIDRKTKTVTITLALEKARPSRSTGKTRLIASTGGLKTSAESYARRPVFFTANVFFFPLKTNEGAEHLETKEKDARPSAKNGDRRRDRISAGRS